MKTKAENKAAMREAQARFRARVKQYTLSIKKEVAVPLEHKLVDLGMSISAWATKKAEEEISK